MKTKLLTFYMVLLAFSGFAQPQAFKYQAVIRDPQGGIIANRTVSVRIGLAINDPLATPVYSETHEVATNEFGLINLEVGNGETYLGTFDQIDWNAGTWFLKTELDITGQQNYSFIGATQLLSVPFALYAGKSATALDDADKNPQNEIQDLNLTGNTLYVTNNPQASQINLSPYLDNTDRQTLNLNGKNLSISNGNSVLLPPDNDADTTNELQTLTLTGSRVLTISNGNSVQLASLADADPDPANEIQTLNLNNNTLSISNGNSVQFPNDLDLSATNELQILSINNDTIYLSQSNYIVLPENFDNNPFNEIQTVHYKNDTISLSNSNDIVLPHDFDKDSTNEIQNLLINDNYLSISNGNSIKLYNRHSIEFPQGVDGKLIYFQTEFGYYIVPEDSVLYIIQNWRSIYSNFCNGIYFAGDSIKKSQSTICFLKKRDPLMEPFKIIITDGSQLFIDVPENKLLVLKSCSEIRYNYVNYYIIPPGHHYSGLQGGENETEFTGYFILK